MHLPIINTLIRIRNLFIIFVLICSLFSPTGLKAQLSNEATISIITCRAGDDIYNTFGHSAIRVKDPNTRLDVIYNYGMFSFKEEGFTSKFLRGKLKYWIGKSTLESFMRGYVYEKRTVLEQTLNLDNEQKNSFYKALEENYKPENRYYLYDFFFDNCSTRIRDILANHISDLEYPDSPELQLSFRELLDQHTYRSPWTDFGMDLLVGTISDRMATVEEQMYLPEFLFNHLSKTKIGQDKDLVASISVILDFEAVEQQRDNTPYFTPLLFFIILLFIEVVIYLYNPRSTWLKLYDNIWYLLIGLGGLVLTFMWFGTDHISTKSNLNLIWMNPLILLAMYMKSRKIWAFILILLALSVLQSAFFQSYHGAVYPIIIILILKLLRQIKNE